MTTPSFGTTAWFLDCQEGPLALKRAKELGFKSIHVNASSPLLPDYFAKKANMKRYEESMRNHQIEVSAVSFNLLEHEGPLNFKKKDLFTRSLKEVLNAASTLGVPLLYFPSFHQAEMKSDQIIVATVELLQYACDIAENYPLKIATENTLSPEANIDFIQKVDRENLQILLDIQNPSLWGHSISEMIAKTFPFCADQIHLKEGKEGIMGNVRLGEGSIGLKKLLKELYSLGFKGRLIFENDYRLDAEKKVKVDQENLTQLLKEIFN